MTFKHKLSARLARLWLGLPLFAVLSFASCELGERTVAGPGQLGALDRLQLSPTVVTLAAAATTDFLAVGMTATGDTAQSAVSWSVTGGALVQETQSGGRHYGRYQAGTQPGTYRVVVTAPAGQAGQKSDTADVIVTATATQVAVASVEVTPASASTAVGSAVQLAAVAKDGGGAILSGRPMTWSSSSAQIATVVGGLVTGVAAGTAYIVASTEGKSDTAAIAVTAAPSGPVASVTVSPASASLAPGQVVQLTAILKDASGATLSGRPVTWSSSSAAVAGVSGSGLVTGTTPGSATITATAEGRSGTAAITVAALPPPGGTSTCLTQSGPLLAISGDQSTTYTNTSLSANTRLDARTASWLGVADTPIRIGGSNLCWSAGLIRGNYTETTSWDTMHGAYGLLLYGAAGIVIENVRIHNTGDGVSFNDGGSDNWTIRGVHLSIGRDDCIENDFGNSGLIEDNLFDGCYVGYSSRSYKTVPDNSGKVVTVRNTLWRLVDMPTGYSQPGHGRFWKMDPGNRDPRLALHDNIFRMDTPANCCGDFLIPPPEYLASCSNNIIVWLGAGEFPEPVPSCFTLTRDKSVWDNAVAAWRAAHPQVAQQYPFP